MLLDSPADQQEGTTKAAGGEHAEGGGSRARRSVPLSHGGLAAWRRHPGAPLLVLAQIAGDIDADNRAPASV